METMIVSDGKRIVDIPYDENLNGIIDFCDEVGGFILYVDSLDGLEVLEVYKEG